MDRGRESILWRRFTRVSKSTTMAAMQGRPCIAIRDRFLVDQGAYNPWGIVQSYNTVAHMLGLHRIENFSADARMVITNKTPHAPYRGAGRPEAVFVMDRVIDRLARSLDMDPAEVRRRNFVTEAEMPYDTGQLYRDGQPLVYDTGNFPEALEKALEKIGYDAFRSEQASLRDQGVYRGVGISSYVEGTGVGPYEGATVYVDHSGGVVVAAGACSQGQDARRHLLNSQPMRLTGPSDGDQCRHRGDSYGGRDICQPQCSGGRQCGE